MKTKEDINIIENLNEFLTSDESLKDFKERIDMNEMQLIRAYRLINLSEQARFMTLLLLKGFKSNDVKIIMNLNNEQLDLLSDVSEYNIISNLKEQGMTNQRIADIYKVSEGTIRNKFHKLEQNIKVKS